MKPTEKDRLDVPWLDAQHFENRRNYPPEELARHAGRHIAWSWDGTQILVSGETMEAVEVQLEAAGVDPARVVFDFVLPGDATLLGSIGLHG